MKILKADFIAGATSLSNLPSKPENEVAVFGRSNVGKSSFINRLCERKALARSSSTPGRTKQLNLFGLTIRTDAGEDKGVVLVDVPGFGYAMFSKEERQELSKLMVAYIEKRKALRVVLLLNDIRRAPEDDELAIREMAFRSERHLIVVLTKADKINRRERDAAVRQRAAEYGLEPEDVFVTGEKEPTGALLSHVMTLV